jgi:ceramide glucosyltransferase
VSTDALLSLAEMSALLAGLGLVATLAGTVAALRFARHRIPVAKQRPPISILKPLCGDEPLLEQALTTFCQLDYPEFQLVLGVQDAADPALAVVDRLLERFAHIDMIVVVDPALHGLNRKVSNLVNMLPAARHDLLVFADSDLHVPPDYLQRVGDALAQPGIGLVTTLSAGRLGVPTLVSVLGGMQISHSFLPGVLLSRLLGRQDCLGTTMALHRRVLGQAGGLAGLLGHLADDHVLGKKVQALGLEVGLASVVTATTVAEKSFPALWAHELRWARTMGALESLLFLTSALQYPLFWAGLALACSGGAAPFAILFVVAWAVRAVGVVGVNLTIRRTPGVGSWRFAATAAFLTPLRDILSIAVLVASYCGDRVTWRGHVLRADNGLARSVADRFAAQAAPAGAIIALTEESP